MVGENNPERFLIHLDMGEDLEEDQLDLLTRQLQREILDTDVETVEIVSGDDIPEGAKAGEAITWGALAIEVLPTFLPSVVEFLKSWVIREKSRKVTIQTQIGDRSIKLDYSSTGIKENELNELVSILTASMQQTETKEEKSAEQAPPTAEGQLKEESTAETEEKPAEDDLVEDSTIEDPVKGTGGVVAEGEVKEQKTEDVEPPILQPEEKTDGKSSESEIADTVEEKPEKSE